MILLFEYPGPTSTPSPTPNINIHYLLIYNPHLILNPITILKPKPSPNPRSISIPNLLHWLIILTLTQSQPLLLILIPTVIFSLKVTIALSLAIDAFINASNGYQILKCNSNGHYWGVRPLKSSKMTWLFDKCPLLLFQASE